MYIFKHVTDCFNSELKGKFQLLISIVFFYILKQQKMKYLLPLSCFILRPDFHKDQTLFWSQSSLSLSWQSNLFLVLSIQKTGLRGITETKRQIFDIYSTIHCMHLFLKNQWSNSIFYFETKYIL